MTLLEKCAATSGILFVLFTIFLRTDNCPALIAIVWFITFLSLFVEAIAWVWL